MSLAGIWTGKGIDKLAAQTAGGPAIRITRIVLGDGGGIVPAVLPSQTALFRELWRGNVNTVLIDPDTPNAVVVESVIPYNVGGFFIREWGLLDADGNLIAVGPHAEFYKPKLEVGSGAELLERIMLPIATAGLVSLTVSSDALATRDFVIRTATDIAERGDTTVSEAAEAALAPVRTLAENHHVRHATGGPDPLTPADIGAAANTITITAGAGLSGGGNLTANRTFAVKLINAVNSTDATSAATANAVKIAYDKAMAAFNRAPYELCEFYFFRHPTLKPGFQPAQGGLLANAAELYPEAWAYLQTTEGRKLCKTEAEWQAMTTATWATLADGSKVGWNGIGGAPFYVLDTANGTLRLPDLRGMYAEAAGFDSLGVGGAHGDAVRNITGRITPHNNSAYLGQGMGYIEGEAIRTVPANSTTTQPTGGNWGLDASRVVPVAAKNQVRAWGALACVYLGQPAS